MKLEINNNSEHISSTNDYSSENRGFYERQNNFGEMLQEGVRLAQEGRRVEAKPLLLQVAEAEPENETAWLWLASISEYPEELLIFLQNVLKINPQNERAIEWSKSTKSLLAKTFVQRGIDASNDNQIDFARQCFLQAIVNEAENEMAWLWLASVTETVEEKMLHLQKVLNFNPENETALSSLQDLKKQKSQSLLRKANSAAISGDKENSSNLLAEVMKNTPDLEEAWILKAYLTDGFYEKIRCYEKVLELNPANEAAQAGMSSLKILIEKTENQLDVSQQITKFSPESQEDSEPQQEQNSHHEYAENSENSQENSEHAQENSVEFVEESSNVVEENSNSDDYQAETAEQSDEKISFSESLNPAELSSAMPNSMTDNDSNDYLIRDTQMPAAEISVNTDYSAEEFQVSAENSDLYSENYSQNLEETNHETTDFAAHDESETKSFESRPDENEAATENQTSQYSMQMQDESEDYLIDNTQIPNSENFYPTENAQNKSAPLNMVEENFFETAQSVEADHFGEVSPNYPENPQENVPEFVEENSVKFDESSVENTYKAEFAAQTFAENSSDSSHLQVNNFYASSPAADVYEIPSEREYFADYNQPAVEFSDSENSENAPIVSAQTLEPAVQSYADEDYSAETSANYFHESNQHEENSEEHFEAENPEVFVSEMTETSAEFQPQVETADCPFCGFGNESQTISCTSCRTMLSLSDLEAILANKEADREILARAIETMEEEKVSRSLDVDEFCLLGIAYLNAKNLRKGLESLQEASKLNPTDVVLSSKVNFLAIRINEIERQESKNQVNALTSRTIMVVDDSPTVRKLISGKLEKSGHSVVTAVDGIEALEKIKEANPDLILLDIAMPEMDGYQVCKLIRSNENTKDIPVVMISGKDGFFDKVRGKMSGSTDYITKPFGPETLMKTIETYLN